MSSTSLLPPAPPPRRRWRRPRPPSDRSRLSRLCKDGRPDLALELFWSLRKPAPTLLWNTLLIGFTSNSMPLRALSLLSSMASSSPSPPRPDPYTFSSALKACADARQLLHGRSLHCLLLRTLAPPLPAVVLNSLLHMYASCLPPSDPLALPFLLSLFHRMPSRTAASWNTLLSWASPDPLALRLLSDMLRSGTAPTPVTFVALFPAAAADRRLADALLSLLLRIGPDTISLCSAISMFSDLSDSPAARRVFDYAPAPTTELFNSLAGAYLHNDMPAEAATLLTQLFRSRTQRPDTVSLLHALAAASSPRAGRQLHGYILKTRNSAVIILNALVSMYSRCGLVDDAFAAFRQMEEKDTVSWNTIISSFVQNGMDFEALLLAHQLQKDGYALDSVTVTALLSAASNICDIRVGKQAHAYLIRHELQSPGISSYLIDMYSKSGCIETARRLFVMDRSEERDQVTWNAMIAGYSQHGQTDEALSVLRMMLEETDLRPNSVTLSSVIPACGLIGGGIRLGKEMHGYAVRHCLDGNVFVGSALVDMYSKCGKIAYAERVFEEMRDRSAVTYTTMISGYGQHGLGDKALSLFKTMLVGGMRPDGVTFVAIMSACSYTGLVEEGLEIFQSMEREYGVPVMPEHLCCVVDMLGRAGRVEEAYELAMELGDEGATVGIWGSLLAACRTHRKFELGNVVAERLIEIEKGGGQAGYHVLMSNVYAAQKRWKKVDKLRKRMRKKGLAKEPGSSWIELGDETRRFVSKDQSHPEQDEIHEVLEELVAEMKQHRHERAAKDHLDEELEFVD